MKTIRFYGHSDDCAEVDGTAPGCDEYVCVAESADFEVLASDGRLVVRVEYAPETLGAEGPATWLLGTMLADEGEAVPRWPMRFEPEHEYSHALVIEAPDDVTVRRLVAEEGSDA